jgi:signal transduction histidine kinase
MCVALLFPGVADAEPAGWDERMARALSVRLKAIEHELAGIPAQLEGLPVIPVDDQGGTGGFASVHPETDPAQDAPHGVEVRWDEAALVDMVALVPARRYDARGLDPHYGMPDRFTIELLDAEGGVIRKIAEETRARSHPARRGHPFVYEVSPAVEASGLRISAAALPQDTENDKSRIHAWAEVFALAGDRNLAAGGRVNRLGGSAPPAPWHWRPEFLTDGQTPLGLPEIPESGHRNVGWLSNGRERADQSASLTVDLGEVHPVDAVRLLPVRRPTSDLPNGFGFPRKLRIAISDEAKPGEEDWVIAAELRMPNPGHNPVVIGIGSAPARHVRVEAVELWKALESYPAFFALSEVEVLSGKENLALGKPVRSSDGMLNLIGSGGGYWSSAALSDGYGPEGRLVPVGEWMRLYDERLRLETRAHDLRMEALDLVTGWRNAALAVFAVLGLAAAFAIIVLPIRYRINSRKELAGVRERIAGDLHDEVGSNLGSIQMYADLAEGRAGPSEELKRIQRIASETVSAVRDIVWLLRPGGDHRIGVVEHLRETSSIMLETLDWKFHANEAAWGIELPEEANRHLFLFFREALHNILRHARATGAEVAVEARPGEFRLAVSDNGAGIPAERLNRPSTLRALRQRAEALNAAFHVESRPGQGTRLELVIPLAKRGKRKSPVA